MQNPFFEIIRRRSREEWISFYKKKLLAFRDYAQNNGEKAAILALVVGIASVVFFKVVVLIVSLLALWFLIVIAVSESK